MGTAGFGGSGSGNSTTRSGYTLHSGGIDLVGGRGMANGGTAVRMTSLYALVSGYGGSISGNLVLGGGNAGFSVGSTSSIPGGLTGGGCNWTWGGGGTYNLDVYHSGSARFNRGGGGNTYDDNGTNYAGTIGGQYDYEWPPTEPQSVGATASSSSAGTVTVTFAGPADGQSLYKYSVWEGGTYLGDNYNGNFTVTGLTPGTSHQFNVRAHNGTTDAAGSQSVPGYSNSVVAPGPPQAPTGLSAAPSTNHTGQIGLSWTAPSNTGNSAITGYNIFNADTNVQIGSTTGTGTTYTATGLTGYQTYNFYVKARNSFSDANNQLSAASGNASAVAPAPPGAPTSLSAVADTLVPGKITLSWTAPSVTGTGGITGYNVYFSTNALIANTTGTGTSYIVTGLNPGQTYSFYVTARNALADNEGSQSAQSNTATAQALGEPPAPTALTASVPTTVSNRIHLVWTPPAGGRTGFNVFERNTTTGTDTLVAFVKSSFYDVDGLDTATHTYFVRTTNTYTDTLSTGYPGNYGGPASSAVSAAASPDFSDSVPNITAATDSTNSAFNGTYVVNAITPTTIRYAKTAPDVAAVAVAAGATVVDNTNATFNGTFTLASIPSVSTFTYAKTASNIPSTAMAGGTITNNTNALFNVLTPTTVSSVNVGAKTITYPVSPGGTVSSVAVPVNALPAPRSTVTNQSNAIYNGTGLTITSVPSPTTFTYAKTNADVAQSNASGTVTDTTNIQYYNGTFVVASVPSYNTFTYASTGPDQASVAVTNPPGGDTFRLTSPAKLDIKYRSGWAG